LKWFDDAMTVRLDHTIVFAQDPHRSATFLADVLGLPAPKPLGHFMVVAMDNGVSIDFMRTDNPITSQHYAFHVSDDVWDAGFARITEQDLPYWADPSTSRPGEVSYAGGGRRVYFQDPSGHFLEIFTQP
jgi:catechol 2,3-dioxygenase-like lactoylglutathione lyase family enzyme